MKQETQDRLLKDAMTAADSWHKESLEWRKLALEKSGYLLILRTRMPAFFVAGVLTALLGILTLATFL